MPKFSEKFKELRNATKVASATTTKATAKNIAVVKPKTTAKAEKPKTEKKEEPNPIEIALTKYFEAEAKRDPAFEKKYREGKKTVHQAFEYLYELHRPGNKGKCAATDNDDDNALAKKFIMDDSIPATKKVATPTPKSKVQNPEPKDDIDIDLDEFDDDSMESNERKEMEEEVPTPKRNNKVKQQSNKTTKQPKVKELQEFKMFDDELDLDF